MCRSSSRTAGVHSRSSADVWPMSLVSPTTARSSSASSSSRNPCRTTAWSSAITIVIGVVDTRASVVTGPWRDTSARFARSPSCAERSRGRSRPRCGRRSRCRRSGRGRPSRCRARSPPRTGRRCGSVPWRCPAAARGSAWLSAAARAGAAALQVRSRDVVSRRTRLDQPVAAPALLDLGNSHEELAALDAARDGIRGGQPDTAGGRIDQRADRHLRRSVEQPHEPVPCAGHLDQHPAADGREHDGLGERRGRPRGRACRAGRRTRASSMHAPAAPQIPDRRPALTVRSLRDGRTPSCCASTLTCRALVRPFGVAYTPAAYPCAATPGRTQGAKRGQSARGDLI